VAHALDEGLAGDAAKDHAAKALLDITADRVAVFGNDDAAAPGGIEEGVQAGHIRPHGGGKEHDGPWKGGNGMVHAVQVSALRNDAQVLVHGQYFCGTGAEDGLRIGQNDLVHKRPQPLH